MISDCITTVADLSVPSLHSVSPQFLVQTPPLSQCEICVIVPVRNEAERIESTLAALTYQIDLEGRPLDPTRYEVILLANNCSDDSAVIAHHFAKQHPNLVLHIVEKTLPASKANIGWVRKRLMDEAHHRLMRLGRNRGVIASTDGDTRVAPNWIASTLYEIARGADAVGGRIITDYRDRQTLTPYARACHLREVGYRFLVAELEAHLDPDPFDPFPRHFQHYGASLAVTAEMYQHAGGLPAVKTSEDVALYRALVRINARFRHSPLVRVTTSARQVGRAQGGLANQLNTWTEMGHQQQSVFVESAKAIATRLHAHRELKLLWQRCLNGYQPSSKDVALSATRLGIDRDWLTDAMTQSVSIGALFELIEQQQQGVWQQRWPLVKVEQAIHELRLLLGPLRSYSNSAPHKSPIASHGSVDIKCAARASGRALTVQGICCF